MYLNLAACPGYIGLACVNGTCPIANKEEYIEYGVPVPSSCGMCSSYKGCEDCMCYDTDMCSFGKRKKHFLTQEGYLLMTDWYLRTVLNMLSSGKRLSNNILKYSGLPTYRSKAMYKAYKNSKRKRGKI